MEFLTDQEIAELKRILRDYQHFESPESQENFLIICGLRNYINRIQLSKSSTTFLLSVFAKLSEVYPIKNNSRRLGLLVFLESIIANAEGNLDDNEKNFIRHVINKCNQWEQSKQQPSPKVAQQSPQPTASRPPIQPSVNTRPPANTRPQPTLQTNTRPQSTKPTVTNQPRPTGQPILTVDNAIAIGTQTWFILLPIVVIWLFIGASSQSFIDAANDNQMLVPLIFFGSIGGLFSGLGGWIAWWRVAVARRPIQWEQALLYSVIGLVCGAVCWASIGYILSFGGKLRDYGWFVGFFFGLIVVGAIFGWLNFRRTRA